MSLSTLFAAFVFVRKGLERWTCWALLPWTFSAGTSITAEYSVDFLLGGPTDIYISYLHGFTVAVLFRKAGETGMS